MKIRQSGMPEEAAWERFFNVPLVLDRLGLVAGPGLRDVVEVGCGYGTFTMELARRVSGLVHAYDVEPALVERTRKRAEKAGLKNVVAEVRDVLERGCGPDSGPVDAVLLFNILHCEVPTDLLGRAADAVRPGGEVVVVHWRYDPTTPRGPAMEIRPQPKQVARWAADTGKLAVPEASVDLPPWHYGWRFRRTSPAQEPPAPPS